MNAIELLEDQHQHIRSLMSLVGEAETEQVRKRAFDQLRELIAVHETAEEIVIRPVTRRAFPGGEQVADARMAEENEGKSVLAELEKLDVTDPAFAKTFAEFRAAVEEHAQHEEQLEFRALRDHVDGESLDKMGQRIQQAEAAAPTHPHPAAKTTATNALLGPFASIADRIRDALAS
ncbi:MAG TPA: hemerythrin domain-containing protein [Mycobacteriales bacterium]|nr:hemerythrin domain-containing protein [Mycobacteriales bacterium]